MTSSHTRLLMSDSEEEYGPLAAAWGDQAPKTVQPDWNSLLDPSVKTGPNDVGSGNLHRKGKNYKPIDEEYILAHRKNQQVPKKKMQEAIRKTEEALGLPESTRLSKKKPGNHKKYSTPSQTSPVSLQKTTSLPKRSKTVELATIRSPPINDEVGSKWSQSTLVDTPFWEQKNQSDSEKKNDMAHPNWTSTALPTPSSPPPMTKTDTVTHSKTQSLPASKKSPRKTGHGWDFLDEITETKPTDDETVTTNTKDERREKNKGQIWSTSTADAQDSGWNTPGENNWSTDSNWNTPSLGKNANTKNGWDVASVSSDSNSIPSDRPSWLNTIPNQDNSSNHHQRRDSNNGRTSRFSNPSKQRYSDYSTPDLPKPANYQGNRRVFIPTETAPPPPPKNSLLVTVNVELSESVKVPVPIRELDEPSKLAQEFGEKYKVQTPSVIAALTKLFSSQKELAAKKKQQKLQRRVHNHTTHSPVSSAGHHPSPQPQPQPASFSSYTSNRFANTTSPPTESASPLESALK
ncbi:hypothetical protein A0J61_03345 [Choanephora cucurbitarum]|uniref:Uncharacterized protein n=1 Tax=Choanephora cucurbitarum TaxID=101091 RepID=A0A1C7NHX6_9FUNG|nr:hypothetical protein A0J61_03345 [Choanephora cucurbitarum]